MPPVTDPNLLVGLSSSDDAAVYRISDDLAAVLTVDFFTPVVDDPYDFGRIAVTNALSDIYAMGAKPAVALNVVSFPSRSLPVEILEQILRGGSDQSKTAGVSIAGGHSIDDPEPKYGQVVLGFVHPKRIITNSTARAGDILFLTKPIGTGIIATAIKNAAAPPEVIDRAVANMTTLNRTASEVMQRIGVHACTDVTGFGLLGHLREMTLASKVGTAIDFKAVPAIEGTRELLALDMAPGGTSRNLAFLTDNNAVVWEADVTEDDRLLLADAQTAGGLLISVAAEKADELECQLVKSGSFAAPIGEIIDDPTCRIHVR